MFRQHEPLRMSPLDSNDWTRMRKGTWWLRRGVRFDAMRYWYQYSDFGRFPGITYFSNLPDLLCMSDSLDVHEATARMRRHNEESLVHSVTFWTYSIATLLRWKGVNAGAPGRYLFLMGWVTIFLLHMTRQLELGELIMSRDSFCR